MTVIHWNQSFVALYNFIWLLLNSFTDVENILLAFIDIVIIKSGFKIDIIEINT